MGKDCESSDFDFEYEMSTPPLGNPATRDFNIAPCIDTCSNVLKRQEQDAYVHKMGARLKQQYITAGRNHQNGVGEGINRWVYPIVTYHAFPVESKVKYHGINKTKKVSHYHLY